MPTLNGVLETSLYVADLGRAADFYRRLFRMATLVEDERLCALSVEGRQVLLLFRQGGSVTPAVLPGGTIPPHDGSGHLHLAFAIPAAEMGAWENWLQENGVAVESRVAWSRGGHSIYFRDPDNHLIELATPGIWSIY
jgi:catechol 2,3-dioxygenase-like lactoylglutathione lyase family enzyme